MSVAVLSVCGLVLVLPPGLVAFILTVTGLGPYSSRGYQLVQQLDWTATQVRAFAPLERITSGVDAGDWVPRDEPALWPQIVWKLGPGNN